MPRSIASILILAALSFSCLSPLCGSGLEEIGPFSSSDRVLVLAPHPDDETIGASGAIQRALSSGARVKVVCYTLGDNNEWAFIIYEKRLTIRRSEFLHMGELRRKETLAAMGLLGLDKGDIAFLGYPDYGTLEILTRYWGKRPLKTMFTRSRSVPYPECVSYGAPYVGQSILADIKKVISDFKPTKIFVSHPADTNRDHSSLYVFTRVALWDLEGNIDSPLVYPYIVHLPGWPAHKGFHPDEVLETPAKLSGVSWKQLSLTPEEAAKKERAIERYKTQLEYSKGFLMTFAKRTEIFGDYPEVRLEGPKDGAIAWKEINFSIEEKAESPDITGLAYAVKGGELLVRVDAKKPIDKEFTFGLYLLGYKKGRDFASMPKMFVKISELGIRLRDKFDFRPPGEARIGYDKNMLVIRLPLSYLGEPDRVLARARSHDIEYDFTSWRVLELEGH